MRPPFRPAALALLCACSTLAAHAACDEQASAECLQSFQPAAAGRFSYYASRQPNQQGIAPAQALIVLHGHPRDAGHTFNASLQAARQANQLANTLIVAPLYQVADATHCHTPGEPDAQAGDLLWTCESWLQGEPASNAPLTAFTALDALQAQLLRQWPSLQRITVAGFSAGAQMVQHYIGFARPPATLAVRYVVADPGTWLYFDPQRPNPDISRDNCPALNRWKYGMENLPEHLGRSAAEARAAYATATIRYLEGEADTGTGKGTYYGILDKSCAATAQGPYRLQRGQAYARHDQDNLKTGTRHRLQTVPGCAHDVSCVFPSAAGQAALFDLPQPTQAP